MTKQWQNTALNDATQSVPAVPHTIIALKKIEHWIFSHRNFFFLSVVGACFRALGNSSMLSVIQCTVLLCVCISWWYIAGSCHVRWLPYRFICFLCDTETGPNISDVLYLRWMCGEHYHESRPFDLISEPPLWCRIGVSMLSNMKGSEFESIMRTGLLCCIWHWDSLYSWCTIKGNVKIKDHRNFVPDQCSPMQCLRIEQFWLMISISRGVHYVDRELISKTVITSLQ